MKIGIIYTSYQMANYVDMSLNPWVSARSNRVDGHTYLIVAVSLPFEGFPLESSVDDTESFLRNRLYRGDIDHLICQKTPLKETEARGLALKWLVGQNVDVLWMCDGDERFTQSDISGAARFVDDNPWVQWFRLPYRNLVFDEKHFLAEPFTPPRIHRVYAPGGYKVCNFWDDNNVLYNRPWMVDSPVIQDIAFSSMPIPTSSANPLHYTWLNNERSRKNIEYQTKSRKWLCSYRWDEEANQLRFNEPYFAARGLPLPEVISLDSSP